MADDVTIQIGASVNKLSSDVDAAKGKIESISESVDKVKESVGGLAELFGVAFSLEAVKSFIESMADLGTQTERTAAMLGMSTEQVGQFNAIALATGSSSDGMSVAMQRLAMNMQRAQQETGPAAQAFKALGLNAKELSTMPLPDVVGKIADRFAQWGDGINKTAIAMALMGRSGAQMIPVLDRGASGIDELGKMAERTGTALSEETARGFHDTHEAIVEANLSVHGIGISLMSTFKPAIDAALKGITEAAQGFNGWLKDTGDLNIVLKSTDDLVTTLTKDIKDLRDAFGLGDVKLFDFKSDLKDLTKIMDGLSAAEKIVRGFISEGFSGAKNAAVSGFGKIQSDQMMQDFDRLFAAREKAASGPLALTVTPKKPQAPGIADNSQADIAALQARMKATDLYFQGLDEHTKSSAKTGDITEAEKTQALKDSLDRRWALDQGYFSDLKAAASGNATELAKIDGELAVAHQKYVNDRRKIDDEARQAAVKSWTSGLTTITSAFNSQLKSLLNGTENFATAMRNIFQDLTMKILEMIEQLLVKKAAAALAGMFGDPTALAGRLKSIAADMGQAYAGFVAFYAPTLGPGAPAAAAAQVAAAQATATGMASFDVGAWAIPRDMPAMVHAGEMVVPAGPAQTFRDMLGGGGSGGGGGVTHNWNISAVDARSFTQMLNNNSSALSKAITQAMRNSVLKPALA